MARSPRPTRTHDSAILRSLERGEIDVAEAGRRFEALDGGDPLPTAQADDQIDPASATTRMPALEPDDA